MPQCVFKICAWGFFSSGYYRIKTRFNKNTHFLKSLKRDSFVGKNQSCLWEEGKDKLGIWD